MIGKKRRKTKTAEVLLILAAYMILSAGLSVTQGKAENETAQPVHSTEISGQIAAEAEQDLFYN